MMQKIAAGLGPTRLKFDDLSAIRMNKRPQILIILFPADIFEMLS